MAQFPVNNQRGLTDAVNYLLSGPTSSGQGFSYFSTSDVANLNGNYREPYTIPLADTSITNVPLSVAPIAIATVTMVDTLTIQVVFASAQPTAPFLPGQATGLTATGITPSVYDDLITNSCYQVGVVSCTTTGCILRLNTPRTVLAPGSGGTIEIQSMELLLSTDCNGKVTTYAAADKVIINAQLNNVLTVDPAFPGTLVYTVEINRYTANISTIPGSRVIRFDSRKRIAIKDVELTVSGSVQPNVESVFVSVVDEPGAGYYWYILEVYFESTAGSVNVTNSVLGLRSFTAQVLKA